MGNGARREPLLTDMNALPLADDVATQFRGGLDDEVNIGAGPMPVQAAVSINLLDTATHSRDLARATGQNEDLPVGNDATATAQLVAFLGRQP